MPDRAADRFELVVEGEGDAGWFKMPLFVFMAWLTHGAVELYPKTVLKVVDRRTGDVLLTQKWSPPRVAADAEARLRADLERLTADEFVEHWVPQEESTS